MNSDGAFLLKTADEIQNRFSFRDTHNQNKKINIEEMINNVRLEEKEVKRDGYSKASERYGTFNPNSECFNSDVQIRDQKLINNDAYDNLNEKDKNTSNFYSENNTKCNQNSNKSPLTSPKNNNIAITNNNNYSNNNIDKINSDRISDKKINTMIANDNNIKI